MHFFSEENPPEKCKEKLFSRALSVTRSRAVMQRFPPFEPMHVVAHRCTKSIFLSAFGPSGRAANPFRVNELWDCSLTARRFVPGDRARAPVCSSITSQPR